MELTPQQLATWQRAKASVHRVTDVGADCFPVQRAFVDDQSKHVTGVCSRRAGKTEAAARKLLSVAQKKPTSVCLYLALTRLNAKRIVWRTLLDLNAKYALNGLANETELYLRLPNGSTIYLAGASDKTEIEKYRGLALSLVVIDEAQSFPGYIEELIDAVLTPALMDHDGSLVLIGTPGPIKAGYFYNCATSENGWSHHAWTVWDNPWIPRKSGKTVAQHLASEVARRGITAEDPIIQREFFGRWIHDPNALVFRYSAELNHYDALPITQGWQVVVGVDLGWDDADAIAVLGWPGYESRLYLLEEIVTAKQDIAALASQLKSVEARWKPQDWVADFGGLGKKIAQEIAARYDVPLRAADKARKIEHIELLNDAMRTGRFFAKKESRFAQETQLIEWDRDKSNPEKYVISDKYHSDVCDAVLYAYRHALHWLDAPAPAQPIVGKPEWYEAQAKDYEASLITAYEQEKAEQMLDTNGGWGWQ